MPQLVWCSKTKKALPKTEKKATARPMISRGPEEPQPAETLCDTGQCEDPLRAEAIALGLNPHWNAKPETIQKMIDEAKSAGA